LLLFIAYFYISCSLLLLCFLLKESNFSLELVDNLIKEVCLLGNERSEFFLAVSDHFELAIAELVSLKEITLNVVSSSEIDQNFGGVRKDAYCYYENKGVFYILRFQKSIKVKKDNLLCFKICNCATLILIFTWNIETCCDRHKYFLSLLRCL